MQPSRLGDLFTLQPVSQFEPQPLEWLWHGRLAKGKLAILDGDPGMGKSLLSLDLCARLSTGRPLPEESSAGSGSGGCPVANSRQRSKKPMTESSERHPRSPSCHHGNRRGDVLTNSETEPGEAFPQSLADNLIHRARLAEAIVIDTPHPTIRDVRHLQSSRGRISATFLNLF
jgi:hypothetical protein